MWIVFIVLVLQKPIMHHALSGMPIVENTDKIIEIIGSDCHVSTVSITQEVNITQNPFGAIWKGNAGYKWKLDVWRHTS